MKLDPILAGIFFHKVTAISEAMAITLQRTARAAYVKKSAGFRHGALSIRRELTP